MGKAFHIRVGKLPAWLDWRRLLGPGDWRIHDETDGRLDVEAELTRADAADLAARLRGVGLGGALLELEITPPLHRRDLRKAYTEEARRYREASPGFSRPGTRLDKEGKLSLTPEALALQLGEHAKGMRVIDAFSGAGGNAIGFARAGCPVTAIELNWARLTMAKQNARLYGVDHLIKFIAGDARKIVPELEAELLFLDPPWGGHYNKERVTLDKLAPCAEVLECATHIPRHWVKTPPSFDHATLPGFQPEAIFGVGAGDRRRVKFLLLEGP